MSIGPKPTPPHALKKLREAHKSLKQWQALAEGWKRGYEFRIAELKNNAPGKIKGLKNTLRKSRKNHNRICAIREGQKRGFEFRIAELKDYYENRNPFDALFEDLPPLEPDPYNEWFEKNYEALRRKYEHGTRIAVDIENKKVVASGKDLSEVREKLIEIGLDHYDYIFDVIHHYPVI